MNYFKLISENKVVDVLNHPIWIGQDLKGRVVRCDISDAKGVLSSDGVTIMHILGRPDFTDGEYATASIVDVEANEYDELVTLLNIGATVQEDGNTSWENDIDNDEEEIMPNDETLIEFKKRYISKLSNECRQAICDGIDIELSDGQVHHFALEIEDQINLLTISSLISAGETKIPYHASDELCTYYNVEDVRMIIGAATEHRIYHTTYFNSLKNWIMSLNSISEVGAIKYGATIPSKYHSEVFEKMLSDNSDTDGGDK